MTLRDKSTHSEPAQIEFLNQWRGRIISNTGGWFPGKGVFCHGYNMLDELVGEKSYFQILILNATGKMVDRPLADWVEAVYGCLSWPDPRIWCNQIGALAGTARTSVVAATAIGAMASDSTSYGPRTRLEGVKFIQNALFQFKSGITPEEIVLAEASKTRGKPYIAGYIRPIAKGDERIDAMDRVGKKLNLLGGEHLSLAFKIEQILIEKYDERMNINGYVSAFLSDHGFTAQEMYKMFALMVASGVMACYSDTYNRPPNSFLPLRCADIEYSGAPKRKVPL
jgi:hypothetical protein